MELDTPADSRERQRVGEISLDVVADPASASASGDGLGQEPTRPSRRQLLITLGVALAGGSAWLAREHDAAPAKAQPLPRVLSGPRPLWTYRGPERATARLTGPMPLPVLATPAELVTLDPATGAVRRRIGLPAAEGMTAGDLLPAAGRVFTTTIGQVGSYHLTDATADWTLPAQEELGGAKASLTLRCTDGTALYGFADLHGPTGRDRLLFALSVQTRDLLWTRTDATDDVLLDLAAAPGGRLLGRSSTHNLVALNAATGERLWTVRSDEQFTWCAADGELAFIGTGDGGLRAIRLRDGQDSWTLAPQNGESWRCLRPLAADGSVYVLRDSGEVTCHAAADGRQLWSRTLPFRLDARCRPALLDGSLLVPGPADGGVCAVDTEQGTVRWTFRASGPGVDVWSVNAGEGRLFMGHDTVLYALPAG